MRPRVLVLTGNVAHDHSVAADLSHHFDVDVFDSMDAAMEALRKSTYHAVFADVGDFLPLERALAGQQAAVVLNTIGEGVCVIDAAGICRWSNNRMRGFPPNVMEKVKNIARQAHAIFASQLRTAAANLEERPNLSSKKFTFQSEDDRYFELIASPVIDEHGQVRQIVSVVWDATSGRRLQQKIDAIDSAGRELTRLERDLVTKLTPGQRLQLLRDKIIRYSKDLMHFDHFAIRLLDKRANKLEVVIAEGLPPEALEIDLYAQPEGNGISGYVAATGRSYICHDTEKDPRYVLGIAHAKSSLTVPLLLHDGVIGVYNVESEKVGAFNEDDRQFAEIFGRYVGLALNILDLLVVERFTTTGRMADSVVQEMAQPLNDIITEAQSLMEEYIGDDTMRGRLNKIVDDVSLIRHTLKDVKAGPKAVLGADRTANRGEAPLRGKRILLADDEENIRTTIAAILRKHGAEVTVCQDGYEAISALEQAPVHGPYNMVLSDIKMPHRNGYEIFAAARRLRDDLPVMLMTGFGYDPNHSIVRASQEGLSGVLFKPFKVDQLLEEVYKALGVTQPKVPEAEKQATG